MKIGIIGGGAIGLLMGAYLVDDHDVTIITRSKQQAEDLVQNGIHLKKDGRVHVKKAEAVPIEDHDLNDYDLLVVAVKQYALDQIVPLLEETSNQLLFVQNGMSHVPLVKCLSLQRDVFVGIVEHGSLKTNNYTVIHTGMGLIKIASYLQKQCQLPIESNVHFPIVYEEDASEMLTKKLVVNAMINPLTGVLGVPNGQLLDNLYYKRLFDDLFEELSRILQLEIPEETKKHIEDICRKTASNYSSMLRDIQEGRPTEIDSILGYILTIAAQKKLQAPITNSLYLMVKGKE